MAAIKTSAPPLRLIAARAVLALAFLCVQHAATLHWLSHSIEATQHSPDKGLPAADHCDACLAFGALGSAVTVDNLLVAMTFAPGGTSSPANGRALPAATPLAFRSRAPPRPT